MTLLAKLRALEAAYSGRGFVDVTVYGELSAAAVNALPKLLAVVEAAQGNDTFEHWADCDGGDVPEVDCTCGLARLRLALAALDEEEG